ncbi:putative rna (guanine-9-) methyltransferase domain containing [Schistosoma mansoni]|uniref:putative rna (guanine-9-) methyltransferase domain containing n=1 Tax=Schistosoma mansoni TaxID=6183 RepID=UPI0001A62DA6|nr:putative rna (guanine-9-) methyltransferase domain containing [Schistosoma mansoni]|eukprot:XP_018650082.1 putative rna (guanine-9-) methyltransferase domain containing [Schistosoma mansoni]
MPNSCQNRYRRILRRRKERRRQEKFRKKIALRNKIRADLQLNRYHSKKFRKKEVSNRLQIALHEGIRIYIDCSYEALMSPKECNKFAQQLCRLYGANKKATKPLSINLVNFSQHGPLFHACQSKCDGFLTYKIGLYSETPSSITPENIEIVYLSPDAKEPLISISENCAYVLGCLVDEHILKVILRQEAENQGYRAVRLPIEEFTSGKNSNPVLAINHVVDILLAYMENGGDWKAALHSKLPQRFLK